MADQLTVSESEEGTIVYERIEGDSAAARDCKCCEGNHVYGRYVLLPGDPPSYSFSRVRTIHHFINQWIDGHRGNEFEGRRVRVTIELLPVDVEAPVE